MTAASPGSREDALKLARKAGGPRSARRRILELFIARGVGARVEKNEIARAARIYEWARRLRELREELGWRISSHNDRADLKPGEYVLETWIPDKPAKQKIARTVWAEQLSHFPYCQVCGRVAGDPDPFYPGRLITLHVDHRIPKDLGGSPDDPSNLWTLCRICNETKANLRENPDLVGQDVIARIRKAPRDVKARVHEFLAEYFTADKREDDQKPPER